MVIRARWVVAVAAMLVGSGCAPKRVYLYPQEVEYGLRAQTFEVVGLKVDELYVNRLARSELTKIDSTVTAVVLANGAEVEDPRDLIPVVGPNTRTAETAYTWARARERWAVPSTIASVTSAAGFVGLMASFALVGQSLIPLVVSAGTLLLGPLISLSIGKATLPDVSELLVTSFRAYLDDLALLREGRAR